MRHRKLDRAILDQNGPLDQDDQDLVISQLASENSESLRLYKKVLAASILVEIPPLLLLSRAVTPNLLLRAVLGTLIVLLNCLSLFNTVFDVAVAGQVLLKYVHANATRAVNFDGVSVINAVLVVRILYVAFVREKLGWMGVFTFVPVGNLVTLVLLRKWHDGVALELHNLHGLRYKFKNV